MKKTYINPSILIVYLKGGNICQLLISSCNDGAGTDYVKQEYNSYDEKSNSSSSSYNVWDDDWSK